MRLIALSGTAAGVLMTVCCSIPGRTAGPPTVFRSASGQFSVQASTTPTEQHYTVPNGSGKVTTHLFVFQSGRQSRVASFSDYITSSNKGIRPEVMLDGFRAGVVTSTRGKLLQEKKIAYRTYPGRELRIETGQGGLMVLRGYVVGRRMYSVLGGAMKREFSEREVASFLDSFTLTK